MPACGPESSPPTSVQAVDTSSFTSHLEHFCFIFLPVFRWGGDIMEEGARGGWPAVGRAVDRRLLKVQDPSRGATVFSSPPQSSPALSHLSWPIFPFTSLGWFLTPHDL